MTSLAEQRKREAAAGAVALVERGMKLGLGTGSTVAHFLELLAQRLERGEVDDVVGVPTSERTTAQASQLGIRLGSLQNLAPLDLAVDGADEVAPGLNLIKGMGAALLREKMVAQASLRFVVIADDSKVVPSLGSRSPLPVEVVHFAWEAHLPFLESLGAAPVLRRHEDGKPVVTDNGNLLLDCHFGGGIKDPRALEAHLARRAGVVDCGLFLGMASAAYIASDAGLLVLGSDYDG